MTTWRERIFSWRRHRRSVAAGIATCLLVTAGTFFMSHPFMCDGCSTPRIGYFNGFVLLSVVALALLSLTERGSAFSVGFLAALVALTVLSVGTFTAAWFDPVRTLIEYNRDATIRRRGENARRAAERRWLDSMRVHGMDRAEGARRPLMLRACMERFREQSPSRSLPRDSIALAHLGGGCGNFDGYFRPGRTGWLWSYVLPSDTANGEGFTIELYPDPVLAIKGPRYSLDARGLLTVREEASAPSHAVFSVPQLLDSLRGCVRAVRDSVSASQGPVATLHEIAAAGNSACQPLNLQLPGDQQLADTTLAKDPNVMVAAMPLSSVGWGTITRYVIVLRPTGRAAPEDFDLFARPRRYGAGETRGYALLADRSFHVTTENREPTAADPAPLPCELDTREVCP